MYIFSICSLKSQSDCLKVLKHFSKAINFLLIYFLWVKSKKDQIIDYYHSLSSFPPASTAAQWSSCAS